MFYSIYLASSYAVWCDGQYWIGNNIWVLVEIHLSLALLSWVDYLATLSLSSWFAKWGNWENSKHLSLRMWGNWDLPFIVDWVQIDPSLLENYLPVSLKVKSMPTLWASSSTHRYKTNTNECSCSPEDIHNNIHSNCNRNSPKLETTQMPINSRIDFLNGDLFVQCILYSSENKLLLHTAIWMNLIGTMLSERIKMQKKVHTKWFHLHQVGNQGKA